MILLGPIELARPVGPEARPLPACYEGNCFCPTGYTYSYERHDCEASNDPGYNYNIQGGGTKSRGNVAYTRGWQGLYGGCTQLLLCFDPTIAGGGVWIGVSLELREDGKRPLAVNSFI